MSQIILNSAENSALIQTLQQSDSKVIPSIYSTKEVYAPSATTWFNQTPSSGSQPTAGSSLTYDLNKYGIAEQMLFTFAINATATMPGQVARCLAAPVGYIYELIDRVDFLSSSRVISTIYAEDLRAQHTNLSHGELAPVVQTAIGAKFGAITAGGAPNLTSTIDAEYCVPVTFGFMKDINTQPNLSFMETCQVRFTFKRPAYLFIADTNGVIESPTGTSTDVKPATLSAAGVTFSGGAGLSSNLPVLQVRYKQYGEADTAQLLAENYNAEQLNMLTSRCFRENPKSFSQTGTNATAVTHAVDLRNVDVVKAFYVFVTRDVDQPTNTEVFTAVAGSRSPQMCFEIQSIKVTASGQEICTINSTQNLYSRLTENGQSINAVASGVPISDRNGTNADALQLHNVYKVQTGLYENDGGGAWSNGWSMREMTNMRIEVTLPPAVPGGAGTGTVSDYRFRGRMEQQGAGISTNYTIHVVEDCSTILSTASNTGRTVNSLTN
jgi:hypothetical protein